MIKKFLLIFLFFLISFQISYSQVLFEDDFENPLIETANPIFSWGQFFDANKSSFGKPFGEGDIYSRSQDVVHSGNYSLKMQLDGRNNICNMCGTRTYTMAPGYTNSMFFVDENSSQNFSNIISGVGANPYAIVYNREDWFSKWKVESINGNKINFVGNSPIQNDMGGSGYFNSGDTIRIPYTCDIDGIVGMNIHRRSDCDGNINYLHGLSGQGDVYLPYGESLSKRMYIYIPSSSLIPENVLKLWYSHFKLPNDDVIGSAMTIYVTAGSYINIGIPEHHYNLLDSIDPIKRDRWYYLEEVWTRETSDMADDGEYKLYVGEDGADISLPVFHRKNLTIGRIIDTSFNGNWQHVTDVSGPVYFDDFKIAQNKSGPTDFDPTKVGLFPSIPKNFQAFNIGDKFIEFNWNASIDNNLSGYKLFKDGIEVGITKNTFFKDINLVPDTSYTYFVQAYDSDENVANSNEINVKTKSLDLFGGDIEKIPFNNSLNNYLLGYWNFENYSLTQVFDNSNYSNDGKLFGGVLITNLTSISNSTNNYASFDGVDDFIEFERYKLDLKTNFTISFWVYSRNLSYSQRVLGKGSTGGSFAYLFNTDYFMLLDENENGGFSLEHRFDYLLTENVWNHVVGVLDENYLYLYINGFEFGKIYYPNLAFSSSEKFVMGARPFGGSHIELFNGYIDEVRIYNTSFNPQEVFSLFLDPFNITNNVDSNFYCGNNMTEIDEVCDGTNLSSKTCQSFGFDKGTLSCQTNCLAYDNSSCEYDPIDDTDDITNNNDKTTDNNNKKSSNGKSVNPSLFSPDSITNINLTNVCIPSYKYFEWSSCENKKQTQFIEDLNDCEGDIVETRDCKLELTGEENLLLNAKKIELINYQKKKYKAKLEQGYNEIIYTDEKVEDSIFLFEDETTGQEYYGQYYDSVDDKHYYTLKRVDEGYITILQDKGIIDNNLYNSSKENNLFNNIIIIFGILFFVVIFIFIIQYFKKIKSNE